MILSPQRLCIYVILLVFMSGCAARVQEVKRECGTPYTVRGKTYHPLKKVEPGFTQDGVASWYGPGFHGKKTASGETYDMHELTAANNVLPLKTLVKVKNLDNGQEVVVRINDRGPFVNDRVIDLSLSAALGLGMVKPGTAPVRITVVDPPKVLVASCQKAAPPKEAPVIAPNPFFRNKVRNVLALIR
jgi:rare lipoprotein A